MVKLFLFRGGRIAFMLAVLACIAVFVVFYASPDIRPFSSYVESKIKKELQAEQCSISNLKLAWDEGPVVDFGQLSLTRKDLVIQDVSAQLSYSFFRVFRGRFGAQLRLRGGEVALNLDETSTAESSAMGLSIALEDTMLHWTFHQETQTFSHLSVYIPLDYAGITFQMDGLSGYMAMDERQQLKQLKFNAYDFSWLPKSWLTYMPNVTALELDARALEDNTWQWHVDMKAEDGMLSVPEAHVQVPVSSLNAEGTAMLQAGDELRLKQFEATSLQWKNGENFGDFSLNWKNDVLHIQAYDGSTAAPMLWSWLWMLGDDEWHQWLNSMQHGRLEGVNATLDLDWQNPLHTTPTQKNIDAMQYHVTTHAMGADIALGLDGDFLYQMDAYVEINQQQLTAQVTSAILNNDIGKIYGNYSIDWDNLMMDIDAKGLVDAGKAHHWLSSESAKELHWGKAPSFVDVQMRWDVDKDEPEEAIISLRPTKECWKLRPKDIPITFERGTTTWDISKGLDLKGMWLRSPWFKGKLSMTLDGDSDWALTDLHLNGAGELNDLTKAFGLPIIKPQGKTSFDVVYQKRNWSGYLDFSANDWDSFAGYDKLDHEKVRIHFSGKPTTTTSLLPINLDKMNSDYKDFKFESEILIDEAKLDLRFEGIDTPAIRGDLRLLIPFDKDVSWGIEAKTTRIDKALFAAYLEEGEKESGYAPRPLNAYVNTDEMVWDKISAKEVSFQFSSDKKSAGNFSAASMVAGEANLRNILGSFTMLEQGKIDLHNLEADGSGQHIVISGSVKPLLSGALAWNGIAFMEGEFGTLMKQAELNKLLQDGDMASLFIGKGEFKEGEPWWRGMEGSFRLRVDDGRIMETGTLTHLLAAISLVDIPKYLVFQRSDVVGAGLLYDKLQIEGTFHAELLDIHGFALVSSALDAGGKGTVHLDSGEVDMLFIARPWQNIEAIIGNIPLFGYILAGEDKSFLRKVYHMHGPASDAAFDELDPEDAGLPRSGLLETLFSLPSQWFGD